jgi:hypothetical protein
VASMSYQSGADAPTGMYHQSRQHPKSAGTPNSSWGRAVRYPAQDQLELNGTAAVQLRPDVIRIRPQHSRRHGPGTSFSPRVVRTPRIGPREPTGRAGVAATRRRGPGRGADTATQLSPRPRQPGSGSEDAQVALRQHSESTEVWARSGAWPPRAQTERRDRSQPFKEDHAG